MELIRGLHNLRPRHQGCVATIGAFDGVHVGHRAVLGQLLEKGKALNLPTVVIVFEPLPREFFSPLQAPARLMSFREKFAALRELGVDRVLRIQFNDRFRIKSAEDFIHEVFVQGLGIKYLVVGDDLRFGHDREGDYELLRTAGEEQGFEVVNTSTLQIQHERVSSTRIRQALADSDFALVDELYGRPFSISGKVVYGRQLGRTLGVPTANLQLHRLRAPLSGVYAAEVFGASEKAQPAVVNVGTRPTVDDGIKAILEAHLIDFKADLYGKAITVVFRQKIREEKKFDSLQELEQNIKADIETGRAFFGL
ncbi:riboflavin kinase/FMN adenylyltransferase [Sinobacterium caligoides]|uniref:Riboflavin biosynthesis protein n=2 Tax=Sinobacterium caligoides TaxID=933926 RepID=A0A3N2D500_9GAMM|nr:bifunctional riboflavin kinase/FAD synthetase [Sinobacterium caligoides]ROR94752.1 riboflavin kinase/FMN adenylyltransferase [Sinobacterium caligoides]